jgi:hypothetical protein
LIYVGGYGPYRKICEEVAENGYQGFKLAHTSKTLS